MCRPLVLAAGFVLVVSSWSSARAQLGNYRYNPATGNVYAVAPVKSWPDAENDAVTAGTHLTTINDLGESLWVGANYGRVWIGYTDQASHGTYVWTSGQMPGYTNWNPGEPNNIGSEFYTEVLVPDGQWNNLPGSYTRSGVAEFEVGATVGNYKYNPATQHVYAQTNGQTFANAELVASAQGANLATMNDAAENTWVNQSYSGSNWIGLRDIAPDGDPADPPGDWTWTSGQAMPYQNWYSPTYGAPGGNEPNGAGEDHGQMRGDGWWNDLPGDRVLNAVIEYPTAVSQTASAYNPATGHIYLKTSSVPWEDAERFAQSQGGHLAAVNDAAENNFVRSFGPGWIGMHDKNQMQNWEWSNGEAVTYQNWNSGEPNGGNVENYAEVMGNGLWNDLSTQSLPGVVELPTDFQATEYRYNPFTEHVYARTNNQTWANAQLFARTLGGDLTSINGAGENNWLQGQYSGDNWIGFYDVADQTGQPDPPGDWRWSNGDPVTYTNWAAPGEPNGASEDHATLRGDQLWNDLNGGNSRRAIVEFAETLTVEAAHFNPATGKVYLRSNSTSWEAAQRLAQAAGGNLATINDAAENEYVAAATRGGWIGSTDRFDEGNFTWVNGDGSTYSNWNSGEPNNSGGEDYAEMQGNGRWNDLGTPASHNRNGVIELDASYSVTEYRWNPANGQVYARTNSVNWQTGELVARAAGGHLAQINDAAENGWVNANYGGDNWIGLIDVTDFVPVPGSDPPGVWAWSTGAMATGAYENWAPGEPNGVNEDAGNMRSDGRWNDLPADRSLRAVVEFDDAVPEPTLTGRRYNPATDKIYAIGPSATWRAAELIARVNGAHLATVNDAAENQWINDNMGSGYRWIGMNDDGHEGGWVWASGEGGAWIQGTGGSSYTNWGSNEPNNAGASGEDHALMRGDGYWNDYPADRTLPGIVEINPRTPVWRFNPGSGKLNAQTDNLIWEDAELQAQHWGGHLATVPNATANEFIRANWGGGWIGLTDRDTEGNFQWVSGQPVTYTNWASGEPNDAGGNEDYTTMRSSGEWNDYGPANYQYGIAEKDLTPPRWIYNPDTGRWYARTANLTWADAEAQAQYWGAHLATINDATEDSFVAGRFANTWIGFTDDENYGGTEFGNTSGEPYPPGGNRGAGWVWASGEPVTYQNWSPNEPNDSGGEDYALIRTTGWNDYPASPYLLDGVAEGDTDAVRGSVEYREDGPTAAVRYAVLGQMTWEEAEAAAQVLGGHLVTVRNQAENDYLQGLAAELQDNIWLGYTDKDDEGDWEWVGYLPTSFTNWNSGEPNDAGGAEDYAMMYWGNGLWNDANATSMAYAIVEFVPEPSTFVLAALGLGLLGALARRRRRR